MRPLRRRYGHSRMQMSAGAVDASATASLGRMRLAARNRGDLQTATLSAAYYAKKTGTTMFVYPGNSFGHAVWRVSDKPGEYLNPINNTGSRVLSVTPGLVVSWHEVSR